MKTLFSLIVVIILSGASFADTYHTQWLDSDAGRSFYGMDDVGHVVLFRSGCTAAGNDCYETFSGGRLVDSSSAAPTFDWDYVKGTCGYPKFSCSIFENGRSVEIANPYTVAYGTNQVLHGNGFGGVFAINGVGDIILDDEYGDLWEEIVDTPSSPALVHAFASVFTPAPVPEPMSLLLFGTGVVFFLTVGRPRKKDVHHEYGRNARQSIGR